MLSIRRSTKALRAGFHRLFGVVCYHIGAHERARGRFQRVLELRGDDFTSYVYLGRLAYSFGDYAGWRRECEHARRTSPERFAKLRHPFDLHQSRTSSSVFEEAGERASWRSMSRVGGTPPDPIGIPGYSDAELLQFRGDDFSSQAERERFRGLEPLLPDEIRRVDIDDLSRRLTS